ncbi:hypothetical protein [Paenibacillus sp. Leaf72]|uniref:hypothetical protein n=1 Tax=Paenibacillus sp. Leaf72 TaxID=1736234 RepID=UPI000AE0AAFC|nr:hypothetical protein [Paenibacillus sp. Leaf72]
MDIGKTPGLSDGKLSFHIDILCKSIALKFSAVGFFALKGGNEMIKVIALFASEGDSPF